MSPAGESLRKRIGGFTLVELLTVIALIITVAALAVPNFAAMLREQRMTNAINSLQVAIMRAKTYAINLEIDYSVEFCNDADDTTYLRIEAESAFLESVPNLQEYIQVVDTWLAVPERWIQCFLARRDAWGASDGYRLYSGIINIYWPRDGSGYAAGWGHFSENAAATDHSGMSSLSKCITYYDKRYETLTGHTKSEINATAWAFPKYGDYNSVSVDERNNVPYDSGGRDLGYQDVNDNNPWSPNYDPMKFYIQDNLVMDDCLYLPYDVKVVLPTSNEDAAKSTLINFDAGTNTIGTRTYEAVCHGWDGTVDLRFGEGGHLLQAKTPEIVLRRGEAVSERQYVRLQLLRGTTRLRKLE